VLPWQAPYPMPPAQNSALSMGQPAWPAHSAPPPQAAMAQAPTMPALPAAAPREAPGLKLHHNTLTKGHLHRQSLSLLPCTAASAWKRWLL
jgi:hypothetical protein